MRSNCSTSQSRRSACVRVRPFSIRASTGDAGPQRRVLDRLEQRHRDLHLVLHRRVLGVAQRHDQEIRRHEHRLLRPGDADRGGRARSRRAGRRTARECGGRPRTPAGASAAAGGSGRRRARPRARSRRRGARRRACSPHRLRPVGPVRDDADVDPRQLADERGDERAAQDLAAATLVRRADEDVRRAALVDERGARSRRARRPPPRGSARRARWRGGAARRARPAPPRESCFAGSRTHSASSCAPSRSAERHARRRIRCERGSGVTSTSTRSATACWLRGSSTSVCRRASTSSATSRSASSRSADSRSTWKKFCSATSARSRG